MISKGARLVLASQVIAVFVNGLAKSLQSTDALDAAQVLQGRMFITLAVNSLVLLSRYPDELPLGAEDVRDLLTLRTIGGICGAAGFYYSIAYLPLADATTLNLLAPLGASIAANFFTSNRFGPAAIGAAIMSLAGVGLITKPRFVADLFRTDLGGTASAESLGVRNDSMERGVAFSALGVVGGICSYTSIVRIGTRTHPLAVTNCFAAGMLLVTTICFAIVPGFDFNFRLSLMQWLMLVALGFSASVMEYLMTAGMATEDSGNAVYMIYSQVVLALAADWLVWQVKPDLMSCLGCGLVVLALFLVARPVDADRKRLASDVGRDV